MAYFGPFQAVYDLPLSAEAVTSGSTATSAWMPASTLVGQKTISLTLTQPVTVLAVYRVVTTTTTTRSTTTTTM